MNISLQLLQQIVNYLQQKPWREVNPLLMQIEKEYQASLQPPPSPIQDKNEVTPNAE